MKTEIPHQRGVCPHLTCLFIVLLSNVLFDAPLRAATITWGAPTTISADSDVSTTGAFAYAYHFTKTSTVASTINGVTFTAFPVGNSNVPITVGSATLTPGSFLDSTDGGAGSTASPFSGLSSAYRGLLGSGTVDFGKLFSFSVGGLMSGQTYRLQIWSNCSGPSGFFFNDPANNSKSLLAAGLPVTLDMNSTNADGGVGQWVVGIFTADSATQTVSLSNVGANDFPVLTAFQLRVVPEPSSSLLLCTAAPIMVAFRRRRYPPCPDFRLGARVAAR